MEPLYTEIEFEHLEQMQGSLYQALKEVPTVVIYRTSVNRKERLAVILLNDRNVSDVKQRAKQNEIAIISKHDVSQSHMIAVVKAELPNLIDGYDTRDNRHWLGLCAMKHFTPVAEEAQVE